MQGEMLQVQVVHSKGNLYGDILGAFPTIRQARWYLQTEVQPLLQYKYDITRMSAFKPHGEDRVFLMRECSPYQLNSDYIPEKELENLKLRWQAWNKLSSEERDILGLNEPPPIPEGM